MQYDDLLPELRAFYEQNAAQRDAHPKTAWKVEERQRFLAYLQNEGKRRLLEVGAGTGQDAEFFRDNGMDVVCADLQRGGHDPLQAIDRRDRRAAHRQLQQDPHVHAVDDDSVTLGCAAAGHDPAAAPRRPFAT